MDDAPAGAVKVSPATASLACVALAPLCAPLLLIAPLPALRALIVDGREPSGRSTRRAAGLALAAWVVEVAIFAGYAWLVVEILSG